MRFPAPSRVLRSCLAVALTLVIAHLAVDLAAVRGTPWHPVRLTRLFSLDLEAGVGTWWAAVQLALAATAAWGAGTTTESDRRWWWSLAILLGLASVEEVVGLHEQLSQMIVAGPLQSSLRYTWVVVGGPMALILAALFTRFLFRQDGVVRRELVAGSVVYVLGVLGVEVLGGWLAHGLGERMLATVAVGAEEGFELLGVALVLAASYRKMLGPSPAG